MITRHDNGDGTTTFSGVSVTIPSSVADKFDVTAVRPAKIGEAVFSRFGINQITQANDLPWIVLAPRPTWKPPAFLAPGIYKWANNAMWAQDGAALWGGSCIRSVFRDMPKPTKIGKWQVHEDGTATYLGES